MLKLLKCTVMVAAIFIAGCNNSNSMPEQGASDAVEAAVTTVSSIADDLATGHVGSSSFVGVNEFTCVGDWTHCSSGKKTRSAKCSNPGVGWTKNITLDFFLADDTPDISCDGLETIGNYVVRIGTEDLPINILGDYSATSDNAVNYDGVTVGGGTKITKDSDNEALIEILGINKTYTDGDGKLVWHQSIRTEPGEPLIINQFTRGGRIITSGTLIVDNNTEGFTATMVFSKVSYVKECCYPISGTITSTFTGTRTGTTTITFTTACGMVNFSNAYPGSLEMITCSSSIN